MLPDLSPGSQHEDDINKSLEDVLRNNLAESVFRPFAEKRQPRTSTLVKGARALGEMRVAVGSDKGRERDEAVSRSYEGDAAAIVAKFENLLRQPFN
jgi:salicylate hydroxylase